MKIDSLDSPDSGWASIKGCLMGKRDIFKYPTPNEYRLYDFLIRRVNGGDDNLANSSSRQ